MRFAALIGALAAFPLDTQSPSLPHLRSTRDFQSVVEIYHCCEHEILFYTVSTAYTGVTKLNPVDSTPDCRYFI